MAAGGMSGRAEARIHSRGHRLDRRFHRGAAARSPAGAFEVVALVAGRDAARLAEMAVRLSARRAVLADPAGYPALREALAGTGITAAAGREAVLEAAAEPADWTMAAIARRRRA